MNPNIKRNKVSRINRMNPINSQPGSYSQVKSYTNKHQHRPNIRHYPGSAHYPPERNSQKNPLFLEKNGFYPEEFHPGNQQQWPETKFNGRINDQHYYSPKLGKMSHHESYGEEKDF